MRLSFDYSPFSLALLSWVDMSAVLLGGGNGEITEAGLLELRAAAYAVLGPMLAAF